MEIRGDRSFSNKTKEALTLLEGSTTFSLVKPYVKVIENAARSGMAAYAAPPTYQVSSNTWTQPTVWYAGTIAHDGCHSLLYHKKKVSLGTKPPAEAWTGVQAEKTCLSFQAEVLTEIKADNYYIKYVRDLMANPTYQDIPYSQRNW